MAEDGVMEEASAQRVSHKQAVGQELPAGYDVPVAMIVYKRLDLTRQSFAAVRKIRPQKLYIIADGPRGEEDRDKVAAVREYLDTHIDWECEVHRDYAEENYGPRYRMPTGMAWVFAQEERAVFLEDDIVATEDFFAYCRELLDRYENDARVMMISGTNIIAGRTEWGDTDICFSYFASNWGWATWRRAFQSYDVNMHSWPACKKTGQLKKQLTKAAYTNLTILFDDLQYHWYSQAWDYQWLYMMIANGGVGIVPRCNLVRNIGMGHEDAIHAKDSARLLSRMESLSVGEISLPVRCSEEVVRSESYDLAYQQQDYPMALPLWKRAKYSIRAWLNERAMRLIRAMEQDETYFDEVLEERYKLTAGEQAWNPGDRYRQLSGRELRESARAYRSYLRNQRQRRKA